MGKMFFCMRCGEHHPADEFAADLPGIGSVCVSCLNAGIKTPENRMVSSGRIQKRVNPLKMLPTEKLARRAKSIGRGLTGSVRPRGCSRQGMSGFSAAGASI